MKKFIYIVLIAFAANFCAFSQDSTLNKKEVPANYPDFSIVHPDSILMQPRFGIFADYLLNIHIADFSRIPGTKSCLSCIGVFENGIGSGFSGGVFFELPFTKEISGQVRTGFSIYDAKLITPEDTYAWVGSQAVEGTFEHTLDAKLSAVELQIMGSYKVWKTLRVHFGADFSIIMNKKYHQWEQLTRPDGATFAVKNPDGSISDLGTRIRNDYEGDIPDVNAFQFGIIGGVNYEFPMNKKKSVLVAPELLYSLGLTNVAKDVSWKLHSLRLGVSLKYVMPPPAIEVKEIRDVKQKIEIDTVKLLSKLVPHDTVRLGFEHIKRDSTYVYDSTLITNIKTVNEEFRRTDTLLIHQNPDFFVDLTAVSVDEHNNERPGQKIQVEEFIATTTHPLLYYIFFDEGVKELPKRYIQFKNGDKDRFSEDKLYNQQTLEIYSNVLNIIGYRLNKYQDAHITLHGIYNGAGKEKDNENLPVERANVIKQYWVDMWGIEPDRIKITSKKLPQNYVDLISTDEDKISEYRRVEMKCDNWDVLKPFIATDTLGNINPPVIRLKPNIKAESGVANWDIAVIQDNKKIKEFKGEGTYPSFIDWNLNDDKYKAPRSMKPLEFVLTAKDKYGQTINSTKQEIPVDFVSIEKKRINQEKDIIIDQYSLILFDLDKFEITSDNKRIIDYIKKRIKPSSEIFINGYTDRVGEEEHNLRLSKNRADAAAAALNVKPKDLKGMGSEILLYDNTLPEGRFYCRTVEIRIETPVENQPMENQPVNNNEEPKN